MDVGVQNDVDKELRGLFRNLKFREASAMRLIAAQLDSLSLVVHSLILGLAPSHLAHPGMMSIASITELYNKAGAMQILDSLGIKDTDGDGIRNCLEPE